VITVEATIDADGDFGNVATVSGNEDDPEPDNNSDDDGGTAESADASLSLTKVISDAPDPIVEGSVLEYTVTATNTGDVDLFDVVITDDMITPSSETCPMVEPGETCELTGTYMVTQTDMVVGEIINTANANGEDPQGNPVPEQTAVEVTFLMQEPERVPVGSPFALLLLLLGVLVLGMGSLKGRDQGLSRR